MTLELMCGCEITDEGQFIVGYSCQYCKECNLMPNVHPFGQGRLMNHNLR